MVVGVGGGSYKKYAANIRRHSTKDCPPGDRAPGFVHP